MTDPAIEKWHQTGCIYLWRYTENTRNYPGWNISADRMGCVSLQELCDLLPQVKYRAQCAVQLSEPTPKVLSVPNNMRGKAKIIKADQLIVELKLDSPDLWELLQDGNTVNLRLGTKGLLELKQGLVAINRGEGDYPIGGTTEEQFLWFWWTPETEKTYNPA